MQIWKLISGVTVAAGLLLATSAQAPAQVAVEIGAQPECPYGYYEAPPYQCAPDGYYGPEWYSGGVFIGAGPWFHGGEHPAAQRAQFHGQAMHDAHGHEAPHGHR